MPSTKTVLGLKNYTVQKSCNYPTIIEISNARYRVTHRQIFQRDLPSTNFYDPEWLVYNAFPNSTQRSTMSTVESIDRFANQISLITFQSRRDPWNIALFSGRQKRDYISYNARIQPLHARRLTSNINRRKLHSCGARFSVPGSRKNINGKV